MPSPAAMIFAISTSKPSGLPSRPFSPNSGWSNFVPTRTLPAELSLAIVVPGSKDGLLATLTLVPPPPPPPQAAAVRASAPASASAPVRRRIRIDATLFSCLARAVGPGRGLWSCRRPVSA